MALRYRLALILIVAVIAYSGLDYLVDNRAVEPKFRKLEEQYAAADLERGINALQRELHHLELFTHDWSAWDDTYDFMDTRDPEYIEGNFVNETFTENAINVMFVCRLDGEVLYGKVMDLHTHQFITLPELPEDKLPAGHPLLLDPGDHTGKSGVILLEYGPLAVAMMPVLTTISTGPSKGVLIFGRFIDDSYVQALVEQTRTPLEIIPMTEAANMPQLSQAVASATTAKPYYQEELSAKKRRVSAVFPDITNSPVLLITATLPRDITSQGATALEHAAISNALVSLLILLVLTLVIDRTFAQRVMQLQEAVHDVALAGELSARLPVQGNDELTRLARQINAMLASIERMEQSRAETAKQAAELEALHSTTAGYAREIANPLAGLMGIAQILLDEDINTPDFRSLLGDMSDAAVRIRDVIRKIEQHTDYRIKPVKGNLAFLGLEHEALYDEDEAKQD